MVATNQSREHVHPTLLEHPGFGDSLRRPREYLEQEELPMAPAAYRVSESQGLWFVIEVATGVMVYAGPGPVRVFVSPAPF